MLSNLLFSYMITVTLTIANIYFVVFFHDFSYFFFIFFFSKWDRIHKIEEIVIATGQK